MVEDLGPTLGGYGLRIRRGCGCDSDRVMWSDNGMVRKTADTSLDGELFVCVSVAGLAAAAASKQVLSSKLESISESTTI